MLESMFTADDLNRYYADISTDQDYIPAKRKLTAVGADDYFTEYDVFHMLDRLKPTATGIDNLPVWFLQVSAPLIAAPLAALFNHSILVGVVPQQWKNAIITPVPKIPVLNATKSREIIFQARGICKKTMQLPPPCLGIEQVTQIIALGVVINDHMTATDHVTALLASCSKLLYALRVLRACLLYTSPSPRDRQKSRMPSSA